MDREKRKAVKYGPDSWKVIHRERSKTESDIDYKTVDKDINIEEEKLQKWLFEFHESIQKKDIKTRKSTIN